MIMGYLKAAGTLVSGASLLTKVLIAIGIAGSLLIAFDAWRSSIWHEGFDAAISKIAAADEKTVARARKAREKVQLCELDGGNWNQSTGRCQ